MPTFSGETLTFGLGRTSCALLEPTRTSVALAGRSRRDDGLIVDADVLGVSTDGTVTVRAAAASATARLPAWSRRLDGMCFRRLNSGA